mmetsp:Transcript_18882/g.23188  ORF Transcript_18882/g.23188 Transcript_18882/m.23188 type:complete len:131 (+) Transcript_18882:1475-1867(+)
MHPSTSSVNTIQSFLSTTAKLCHYWNGFKVCPMTMKSRMKRTHIMMHLFPYKRCHLLPRNNDNYEQSHQIEYHQTILNFFFATRNKATSQSRKPWLVKQIIHENDSLWNDARDLGKCFLMNHNLIIQIIN